MGRRKQSKVEKSPFKLRRRKLADGRESLFIDHTVDGRHEYEFLKLYLIPETSVKAKREKRENTPSGGGDNYRQDRKHG